MRYPTRIEIGKRIQMIRDGRPRAVFAERLGLHPNSLRRYEVGERGPDPEFLRALARLENVSLIWLITGHGKMRTGQNIDPAPCGEPTRTSSASTAEDLIAALRENVNLLKENRELKLELERMKAQVVELKRQVESR